MSPPPFEFEPASFDNTMPLTAMVRLGGVDQATGTLVAVVGTEVRGMQDTPSLAPFGPYVGRPIFQITTYGSDSGETMSFQFVVGGGLAVGGAVSSVTLRSRDSNLCLRSSSERLARACAAVLPYRPS